MQRVIKGEPRRNSEIVKNLLRLKLEDAIKWRKRINKQSWKEKEDLLQNHQQEWDVEGGVLEYYQAGGRKEGELPKGKGKGHGWRGQNNAQCGL